MTPSPTAFRRPLPPDPIEEFDVPHPALPASLDGLRILHLSDFHIRRVCHASDQWQQLEHAVAAVHCDLIALTGDYMDRPREEPAAIEMLDRLSRAWQSPPLGAVGTFGNHDTAQFKELATSLDRIRWIGNAGVVPTPNPALAVLGLDWPEDFVSAALVGPPHFTKGRFTLTLAHYPTAMLAAADFGLPLVLAGHTHAGQIRVSSRLAPHTSSDVPVHLATGILRLRSTLCCISRGLGDGVADGLRLNCPRQIPLYTLRRANLPPVKHGGSAAVVTQVVAW